MKNYTQLMVVAMLIVSPVTGQATTYTYDALNRLIRADYPNGSYIEYSYDAGGNITNINSLPLTDTDNDLIPDVYEIAHGLDPNNPADAPLDPDTDGLSNLKEYQHNTDPYNSDTDGDGYPDGVEASNNTDPTKKNAKPIPTLSEWGMIVLSLLLGAVGFSVGRKKKGSHGIK